MIVAAICSADSGRPKITDQMRTAENYIDLRNC